MNALILVGEAASSKQFVEKVKAAIPDMQLIADTTGVAEGGQDEAKAHVNPNPYDGIITAEGRIGLEHSQTPNYTYCKTIFEKQTGITIPLPERRREAPERAGRTTSTATPRTRARTSRCSPTSPQHVGKNLNNTNWTNTVNTFGTVKVMNTDCASLHAGQVRRRRHLRPRRVRPDDRRPTATGRT